MAQRATADTIYATVLRDWILNKEPYDVNEVINHYRIQTLAHALWELRGRPIGTPEHDWYAAEAILRAAQEYRYKSVREQPYQSYGSTR
jgi:hypothetical protein